MEEILIDNFSDEMNEILGLLSTPNLIDNTVTIVGYKHHTESLKYLVHDA